MTKHNENIVREVLDTLYEANGAILGLTALDTDRFESGNYFHTKEEAESMARKLRAVLNGADVIEMPSESEAEAESERQLELSVACDDKWTEEAYLDGFADCLHWLKSKVK